MSGVEWAEFASSSREIRDGRHLPVQKEEGEERGGESAMREVNTDNAIIRLNGCGGGGGGGEV